MYTESELNAPEVCYPAQNENALKAYEHLRIIRQECFFVYGESAHKTEPILANFWRKPKKKFLILNLLSIHDRMGKKICHATLPLNAVKHFFSYASLIKDK